jgi:hypothetical protein
MPYSELLFQILAQRKRILKAYLMNSIITKHDSYHAFLEQHSAVYLKKANDRYNNDASSKRCYDFFLFHYKLI